MAVVPVITDPLADSIELFGRDIDPANPPVGIALRRHLGLLTAEKLDGQVVHNARFRAESHGAKASGRSHLYETRATKTPGGDYLLMFPDGGHYGGMTRRTRQTGYRKVNDLLAYRSPDKGNTWYGPTIPIEIDYDLHGFVPLIPKDSKRIYCFGTQAILDRMSMRPGLHENAPIGFRYSDDDGYTWSDVTLIHPENDPDFTGMSVMRMCETDRGTWIIGAHDGDWDGSLVTHQYMLRSDDRGATWRVFPEKRPNGWQGKAFPRMDESRPVALGNGKVLVLSRTCDGQLWTFRSDDDGLTWTEPRPTSMVHPDAPPMVFPLSDGTLASFHHNRVPEVQGDKADGTERIRSSHTVRGELWVSFSRDEGESWREPRFVLACALAPVFETAFINYACSYLDAFEDDGILNMFLPFRWHHVLHMQIRESDLMQLPVESDLP